MIKLKKILLESKTNKFIVYHGTNKQFSSFSTQKSINGIIWFTSDKNKILNRTAGADGSGYIITAEVTINNPVGWDLYEKLLLAQIKAQGYDGAILPDGQQFDCFVFSPSQIKILKTEKV